MLLRLAHLMVVAVLCLAGRPALAADPFAPAVVVNDQLITEFDVAQRMRLMQIMGVGGSDVRAMAIESLIDDRLRAQAAKNLGITLTDAQLQAAMSEFAGQRGMTADQMIARLGQAGVTKQAILDLISNQAAFREAMRLRFLARATPTESEIASEQARGPGLGQTELHLAELVLPVRERGEIETAKLAEELYQSLSAGGDFAAAARRYSRSPTGRKGGEVGWMPLDRLPPTIATELALLGAGEITRPIDVPGAVVILKVLE
ncbi:MAG TPA: peptidylprolyl isomerase, partial [Paracoccaceae bacterium]|nr:peptidylprolyl isomerase [Paracoccaceae bacterium]